MLFQSQIENLKIEIADLEAVIADRQLQIQQLQLGENVAASLLEQTATALQTLRPVGEGAIARLKSSLFALFGSDDIPPTDPGDGPDGGGSDCGESES